ncbi:flagellar biosynthetic protein FliR [Nitrospirillum sp. BR 11163]|uniref:flagellar biosynthetic protein FliR n=1 Tax=Nitrospirillum sp. BR 11163 TaxID=3104323 RepID=UPI002AFF10D2|nr:flagellar biosynthetic protein FliR [Nitrospirillum sp. BR 11163]MEA1676083.1 flagellar biosynthetic protein FliR [Nitrospirillum sp. BR 11163]
MLQTFLVSQFYTYLMVFVRLGATFLIMPTMGETFVSTRIRLLFGVMVALAVTPAVGGTLPPEPAQPADMAVLIIGEALIGIFIGTIARTMMGALETAGSLIANHVGLSSAQAFNPAMSQQTTVVNSILGILGILLLFATDMHHMLILAAVRSYGLFPPGGAMPLGDFTEHLTRIFSESFSIGLQMSAPFVVIGLLFFLGMGLVARLVPSIQVFFVTQPLQIALGLLLLGGSLSGLMVYWLRAFQGQMMPFLSS